MVFGDRVWDRDYGAPARRGNFAGSSEGFGVAAADEAEEIEVAACGGAEESRRW